MRTWACVQERLTETRVEEVFLSLVSNVWRAGSQGDRLTFCNFVNSQVEVVKFEAGVVCDGRDGGY